MKRKRLKFKNKEKLQIIVRDGNDQKIFSYSCILDDVNRIRDIIEKLETKFNLGIFYDNPVDKVLQI